MPGDRVGVVVGFGDVGTYLTYMLGSSAGSQAQIFVPRPAASNSARIALTSCFSCWAETSVLG
ncbi:hypothetical protein OHB00_49760 [Streptomyces sp. NBC_00631]|uniref:hypothetical protein n=1 Tax=Streptomyces sp. NBC_00631 TaxID=2975793 RepID=UPI0030E29DA1